MVKLDALGCTRCVYSSCKALAALRHSCDQKPINCQALPAGCPANPGLLLVLDGEQPGQEAELEKWYKAFGPAAGIADKQARDRHTRAAATQRFTYQCAVWPCKRYSHLATPERPHAAVALTKWYRRSQASAEINNDASRLPSNRT